MLPRRGPRLPDDCVATQLATAVAVVGVAAHCVGAASAATARRALGGNAARPPWWATELAAALTPPAACRLEGAALGHGGPRRRAAGLGAGAVAEAQRACAGWRGARRRRRTRSPGGAGAGGAHTLPAARPSWRLALRTQAAHSHATPVWDLPPDPPPPPPDMPVDAPSPPRVPPSPLTLICARLCGCWRCCTAGCQARQQVCEEAVERLAADRWPVDMRPACTCTGAGWHLRRVPLSTAPICATPSHSAYLQQGHVACRSSQASAQPAHSVWPQGDRTQQGVAHR